MAEEAAEMALGWKDCNVIPCELFMAMFCQYQKSGLHNAKG